MRQRVARFFAAAILLLLPATASAQLGGRFEITPTLIYRGVGDVDVEDVDIFDDSLEIDEGSAFGLVVGIPLGNVVTLELLANRQETELLADDGLFSNETVIADVDIDYYHVGVAFEFGGGQVHPFVAASLGVARITVDLPGTTDEDRPSGSLGGGVKIFFGEHFGLRLEGRGYYIALDDDEDRDNDDDRWENEDSVTQAEASVGLIFSW